MTENQARLLFAVAYLIGFILLYPLLEKSVDQELGLYKSHKQEMIK